MFVKLLFINELQFGESKMVIKYTLEQTINKPIDTVADLLEDPNNLAKWQPGFKSMEHLSGTPGQKGAKTKLTYDMGKREIVMTETIIDNNLPDQLDLTFDSDKVHNIQKNKLVKVDDNTTKWISDSEFQLSGYMNIFGIFGKGMFKKQSQIYIDKFKEFAENS